MGDLNEISVFVKVVDAGGFTAAARALGLPKSTVSRRVASLEERLGAQLLVRTTRRMTLTDVGSAYYERCRRIVADLDEADRSVTEAGDRPAGVLRVTAPVVFGERFLGPLVAEYLTRYPDVGVELELDDRVVDVVGEGYDVAVRAGPLRDSTLMVRRLGASSAHVCASPAYLEERGTPQRIEDLADHECILFGRPPGRPWTMVVDGRERSVHVSGRYVVNSFDAARDAALAGLGLALVPVFSAHDDLRRGRLVDVLEGQAFMRGEIHAVWPSTRHLSAKVRAFVDLLVEEFLPDPPWSVPCKEQ